jgi:hypothetical protein
MRGHIKVNHMSKLDAYEREILNAFEKGGLKPVATKAELAKLKAAARATAGYVPSRLVDRSSDPAQNAAATTRRRVAR